jgi:energy-coupling factor transporter transmembrane protein EcfT
MTQWSMIFNTLCIFVAIRYGPAVAFHPNRGLFALSFFAICFLGGLLLLEYSGLELVLRAAGSALPLVAALVFVGWYVRRQKRRSG